MRTIYSYLRSCRAYAWRENYVVQFCLLYLYWKRELSYYKLPPSVVNNLKLYKIHCISHRRGLKRFCNHALRYYVTKVEWTRREESLCYGRACCCSLLILLSNLVFYCFKGAKYRTTLLPSFFPIIYLRCCLGVVFE